MEPTPEQKIAIERLYENESLTENLTDTDARALLEWAQQQITTNADTKLVQAAVSAANESGEAGAPGVLSSANTFLAQELSARADVGSATMRTDTSNTAREAPSESDAPKLGTLSTDSNTPKLGTLSTESSPPQLGVAGEVADTAILTAHADAAIATPTSKPAAAPKKRRAKTKHKKK